MSFEICDGFVQASPEETKEIQLSILKAVKRFCDDNNITYFLMYGTLLGAVRHKGYIPWDDDIDICMLREDYDRFVAEFKDERYLVRSGQTEKHFPYYFAKVVDPRSILTEKIDGEDFNTGINVDLFVLDSIPSEASVREALFKKMFAIRRKLLVHTLDKTVKRKWYKRVMIFVLEAMFRKKAYEYCEQMQSTAKAYAAYPSDSVYEMMTPYGMKSLMPRVYFSSTKQLMFEDDTYSVPAEYEKVLEKLYGDYMTLPPKEKQVTHHNFNIYIKKL